MTTFKILSAQRAAVSTIVFLGILVGSTAILSAQTSKRESYYYLVDVSDLEIVYDRPYFFSSRSVVPFAQLVGLQDVWVSSSKADSHRRDFQIAIQSRRPLKRIEGKIYLPQRSQAELLEFDVSHKLEKPASKAAFWAARERYYQHLIDGGFSGRPWFQHQLQQARREQGKTESNTDNRNRAGWNSIDRTFDMFSGSRAIAENIQLDRNLMVQGDSEQSIDVETIRGITINEFDWTPHLKDKELPKLDRLASFVPHDQHVIFVRSIGSFQAALQQVSSLMSSAFDSFAIQSVDHEVIPGYLRQMAIDMQEIRKQDFAQDVQEIAITGSDPYSELGTDLGVIIQMSNATAAGKFAEYYLKKIGSNKKLFEDLPSGQNVLADRSLSAHVFVKESRLVITNSKYQAQRIRECMENRVADLASLREFHFFRHRYELTEDETAFVFMSDAAIRRWCSAKWRIGQSRRLRALALLQSLQAKHMKGSSQLEFGQTREVSVSIQEKKILGDVTLSRQGVYSSKFGSIRFIIPIAELGIDKVTTQEELAYSRWRDGYQRNWSQAFDPIGIQIKLKPKEVFVDLSVIPIIMNSSYGWLSDGKPLGEYSGDIHPGTLIHFIAAPGVEDSMTSNIDGIKSVEVYFDEDLSFWRDFVDELAAQHYFQKNLQKLPAAIVFDFEDAEKRDKFLTVAKSFLSHAAESEIELEYKGRTYKKFNIRDGVIFPDQDIDFYGDKVDSRVILSLSEDLIKRSIDRQLKPVPESEKRKLLGKQLSVQVNKRFFRAIEGITMDYYRKTIRDRSWKNLPILQEWKREFPELDPLELHRMYWGQRLVCTGGGKYKWDAKMNRAYSTAYGHPARPRIPMGTPFPFKHIQMLDAGLGFETDGIRAKFHLKEK